MVFGRKKKCHTVRVRTAGTYSCLNSNLRTVIITISRCSNTNEVTLADEFYPVLVRENETENKKRTVACYHHHESRRNFAISDPPSFDSTLSFFPIFSLGIPPFPSPRRGLAFAVFLSFQTRRRHHGQKTRIYSANRCKTDT